MQTKNILFYSSNPLRSKTVEAQFKSTNYQCYTSDQLEENLFLIEDLKPFVLILDTALIKEASSLVLPFSAVPHVILIGGDKEGGELLKHPSIQWVKLPFNPKSLVDQIGLLLA
jgi:hypothetical protein